MKFDPLAKQIYTDDGIFVKTMNCPYKMSWNQLETYNAASRKCENCDRLIMDTDGLSDQQLLEIVRQNPDTCLKIDLQQDNIKIITNGFLGQK